MSLCVCMYVFHIVNKTVLKNFITNERFYNESITRIRSTEQRNKRGKLLCICIPLSHFKKALWRSVSISFCDIGIQYRRTSMRVLTKQPEEDSLFVHGRHFIHFRFLLIPEKIFYCYY